MTIKEKVAYLQGLADGLNTKATDEGKLLLSIIDTLDDIADELDMINDNALDIGEELDALSDDLADVEEFLEELELDDLDYDDYWDFDDDYDWDDDDWFKNDDDDDDGDGFAPCDGCGNAHFSIDVNCPDCDAEIKLDKEDIANESVHCPICGKKIELEIDDVDIDTDESE